MPSVGDDTAEKYSRNLLRSGYPSKIILKASIDLNYLVMHIHLYVDFDDY